MKEQNLRLLFPGKSMMKTIGLGFTALGLFSCSTNQEQDVPADPNIILILTDDLGYNDISYYRAMHDVQVSTPPTCKTPHIDKLAEQGIAFTDFYCGAAVCSPSRAALLTGRNKTRTGIYNWVPANSPMHLRDREITMAEMLKQKNYQTAHFGKWHLTGDFKSQPGPMQQGYDHVFYTKNNARPSHYNPHNFFRNDQPLDTLEGYAAHLVVDEAIDWLSHRYENENPFYINIWFNEPHEICAAPKEFTSNHTYREQYYGSIENMDAAVGKLISYIDENGMDENTIIMFSSDNGSEKTYSNMPLKGKKTLNLEGGIKVPFIVKWKDQLPAGVVSSATGSFTDILPTIAEFTATTAPQDRVIDGISLADVWQNPEKEFQREDPIFFYRYFHDPIMVLRKGDWLLTGYEEYYEFTQDVDIRELAKFKPAENEPRWAQWGFQEGHMKSLPGQQPNVFTLHNVKNDPSTENDLADEYPDIVEKMKKKMLDMKDEMVNEGGNWYE